MYRTILVPLDLSPCAHSVVQAAAELARPLGAEVSLLYVLDEPLELDDDLIIEVGPNHERKTVGSHLRQAAEARLPEYEAQLRAAGVAVTRHLATGNVPDRILQTADAVHADLIVMGTHGRTGAARFLLGSVAETVSRRSLVPVMTVRARHHVGCEAHDCATCADAGTAAEARVRAELDG